jgi:hypothetical protein
MYPAYRGLLPQLIQLSPELLLVLLQVPHHREEVIHRLDEYGPLSKKILLIENNPETFAFLKWFEKGFSALCEVFYTFSF